MSREQMDKITNYLKGALLSVVAILLYLNSSVMQTAFLETLGVSPSTMSMTSKVIYLISWDIVLMAILGLLFYKSYEKDIEDIKKNHKEYFSKYLKYWLVSVGIMFVSNIVIMAITGNNTSGNEKAIRDMFSSSPIYVYFSGVIFAPLVEELIFRKCLYHIFPNKYLFIFISGVIFGGMHVITGYSGPLDLLYLIPYCAPGVVFAYIMYKTKNVLVSTGLHFLHNGILISAQLFMYIFMR